MLTIPIKIKREDKVIIIKMLEIAKFNSADFYKLDFLIGYEIYTDILSKLRASQHNDKSIRLTLVQVKVFLSFLNVYAEIGKYELANALALTQKVKQEIYKKATQLINH